jgi:hypothetical protein
MVTDEGVSRCFYSGISSLISRAIGRNPVPEHLLVLMLRAYR